jgi:heme oxygenase
MTTGILGQRLNLSEELRAATFAAHGRLQAEPLFGALARCQLPLESFVGQLRALAVVHGALEQALADSPEARVAAVWRDDLRRLPQLLLDLAYFAPRAVLDVTGAAAAAVRATEVIRRTAAGQPVALLGYLYVIEGSNLGAAVLRRLYARAYLLADDGGLAYWTQDPAAVQPRWTQVCQRLDAQPLTPLERGWVLDAAGTLFGLLHDVFSALYPIQPESLGQVATTINPEAGRHPVPADPRQLGAALRAADACWSRYPYFAHRYGERGQRFARSDAAWLATLGQFDAVQVQQQVRWLGRLLAARGMPTLLLQDQLERLADELAVAVPEESAAAARLRGAALELAQARRQRLTDAELVALGDAFRSRLGDQADTFGPELGELLACAVADELNGCPGAVDSISRWLTAPGRFAVDGSAAVIEAVDRARAAARGGAARPMAGPAGVS